MNMEVIIIFGLLFCGIGIAVLVAVDLLPVHYGLVGGILGIITGVYFRYRQSYPCPFVFRKNKEEKDC